MQFLKIGIGIALFFTGAITVASAFADVPRDAWYKSTLENFLEQQRIDADVAFRPSDSATRDEFVKILIRARGGLSVGIAQFDQFFSDVSPEHPSYLEFQEAGRSGFVHGAGDCIGMNLCFAHPRSFINRAEAAALLARAFNLSGEDSPEFADVIVGSWYEAPIRLASSRCVLQGDAGKRTVRPGDPMNRAEMIVMIDRAMHMLIYGVDCGEETSSSAVKEDRLRPERRPENENLPAKAFEVPSPETPAGIPLMRFDMSAHRVKDIVLTGLTFEAEQGSLFNATKYALWVDHDHDGTVDTPLEKNQAPKGGVVPFQNFSGGGYVISTESVTFEVRATMSASPESTILQLKIAANGIDAEELDGRALSGIRKDGICVGRCHITQQTTPAEVLTILPQGNLFVTESATPIRPHLLLGGAMTEPILRLSFRADGESIDVTALRITSSGSLAGSIDRLELLRSGSSTHFAEASIGTCGSDDLLTINPSDGSALRTFCTFLPAGALRVPEDVRTEILIRARMKSDETGGISNEPIQLWLTGQAVAADHTESGAVNARGVASSTRIAANDGDGTAEGELFIGTDHPAGNRDIIGTLHTSILSTITAIENGSSDPAGSAIATGTRTIGALRFHSAIHGNAQNGSNDVVIDNLLFTVSATNVQIDSSAFLLFNTADHGTTHACSALDSSGGALVGHITGSFFVSCTGLAAASIASGIDSGSVISLALEGDITNPQVSSSAHSLLQLSLQEFTSPRLNFGVGGSHIHFLDQDAAESEDFYWVDLPVTEVQSTGYGL